MQAVNNSNIPIPINEKILEKGLRKMANALNICLSSDNNYAQHLGVTVKSLVDCHPNDILNIYVLDSGISEDNKKKILSLINDNTHVVFKEVKEELFDNFDFSKNSQFTSAIFNRFKIPEFFSDSDRILYMDVDIVVMKNLSDFYNMDMDGKALALISDWNSSIFREFIGVEKYYNSGVMLFDIKKCLECDLYSLLMNALKNNDKELKMPDQDIINLTCQDIIKEVDFVCNAQIHPNLSANVKWISDNINNVKILHYTSALKPWKDIPVPFEEYYLDYLKLTPWKDNIKSAKIKKKLYKIREFIYSVKKIEHNTKYLKFMGIKWFTRVKSDGINHFYFLGFNFLNMKRKKK